MDRMAVRLQARELMGQAAMVLELHGAPIPVALKRRDKREPGRLRKEEAEDRLIGLLSRYWRKQAAAIREKLGPKIERLGNGLALAPALKANADADWFMADMGTDFWDGLREEEIARLVREFQTEALEGIRLFGQRTNIGLDYAAVNTRAANWATQYTNKWLQSLDATTRDALRGALSRFASTPGMTLRDVMQALPFDEMRAEMIAVTEITRVYAEGNRMAGQELMDEFPGVKVTETWITNFDDRLCDLCKPMEGIEVDLSEGEKFHLPDGNDVEGPPAHPRCRCWTDTRTRI